MLYETLTVDGLLLARDLRNVVADPRSLLRDVERGRLVKLRRGAYVAGEVWANSTPRERHLHRIRAVVAMSEKSHIIAGISAAALWGMPIAGPWPTDVTVADQWRGGGRSEPGVRVTAAGFASARMDDVAGFRVTSLARTAICVARLNDFEDAVGSVDWALWRRNPNAVHLTELVEDLDEWKPRTRLHHVEHVLAFSTHLSDSFGESRARAVIDMCGFERPELQAEFADERGKMIVDFFWPRARIAVEFDGKVKYTRNEFTHGDPSEIVWREKKRTDRLRRQAVDVERIVTEEVDRPQILRRILVAAGVPLRA